MQLFTFKFVKIKSNFKIQFLRVLAAFQGLKGRVWPVVAVGPAQDISASTGRSRQALPLAAASSWLRAAEGRGSVSFLTATPVTSWPRVSGALPSALHVGRGQLLTVGLMLP